MIEGSPPYCLIIAERIPGPSGVWVSGRRSPPEPNSPYDQVGWTFPPSFDILRLAACALLQTGNFQHCRDKTKQKNTISTVKLS